MDAVRVERDSFGEIEVPADRLWGAQTQRSLQHFAIGEDRMPRALIAALALVKREAARVNADMGRLDAIISDVIMRAADEVIFGRHDGEFPLVVWQTGSGTQTHMNMNEVLANRASQLLGGSIGEQRLVHPNDHVNCSQSTNDIFSTAVCVACVRGLQEGLLPSLRTLRGTLEAKARDFDDIVKIGRTHLQDATPLMLGQEISGWAAQLGHAHLHIEASLPHLRELAVGGTAVGTGLNAPACFGERVVEGLCVATGLAFVVAPNRFEALAAHDGIVHAHGALKGLAASLYKIANDVRWLASGPRCGLGEISIPENEPGSSMMPGKVNPTQCEALAMVCIQVFGHDASIGFAGASGNFELNVCKPLMAFDMLSSIGLLRDALASFDVYCARGIEPRRARIAELVSRSLMLVTSLAPHIGYDQSAVIAKAAHAKGLTLREAALASGLVSEADFDRWVDAAAQCGPD
jgi:fumarate hydratase class II